MGIMRSSLFRLERPASDIEGSYGPWAAQKSNAKRDEMKLTEADKIYILCQTNNRCTICIGHDKETLITLVGKSPLSFDTI